MSNESCQFPVASSQLPVASYDQSPAPVPKSGSGCPAAHRQETRFRGRIVTRLAREVCQLDERTSVHRDIEVREDKPELIIEQVGDRLGLGVERARRTVKMLIVEPGR
jgi:hypothetical protein